MSFMLLGKTEPPYSKLKTVKGASWHIEGDLWCRVADLWRWLCPFLLFNPVRDLVADIIDVIIGKCSAGNSRRVLTSSG